MEFSPTTGSQNNKPAKAKVAAKPAAVVAVPPAAAAKPEAPAKKKRRNRAVITDETRAQVKKLIKAGKTGREIAKAVGVSMASVNNLKKALGLVKKS